MDIGLKISWDEISRSAEAMISNHGENALAEAKSRARTLRLAGCYSSAVAWESICARIQDRVLDNQFSPKSIGSASHGCDVRPVMGRDTATMPKEKLLTPLQVAERLQVHERTVNRWLQCGDLPGIKNGRDWRIAASNLNSFIERHTNGQLNTASEPK